MITKTGVVTIRDGELNMDGYKFEGDNIITMDECAILAIDEAIGFLKNKREVLKLKIKNDLTIS